MIQAYNIGIFFFVKSLIPSHLLTFILLFWPVRLSPPDQCFTPPPPPSLRQYSLQFRNSHPVFAVKWRHKYGCSISKYLNFPWIFLNLKAQIIQSKFLKLKCIDRGMALQSPLVYGRIFASQIRQFVPRLLRQEQHSCTNARRCTRLVTAYCGFSKDLASPNKRFAFGEDAFFIAEDRARSVLGKMYKIFVSWEE